MTALPDATTRLEAVKDFEHNLVVVAGAGTGKTSLLVGRLASALIRHHFEPRQVLALTFTENAATEMRTRLARLLSAGLRLIGCRCEGPCICTAERDKIDPSDRATIADLGLSAEDRSRIEDVLEAVDDVPLATFHGYCAGLLRQHAQMLGLPPDQSPGADDLARPAFDEAFLDFLRDLDPGVTHEALELFEAGDLGELAWRLRKLPAEGLRELQAKPPRLSPDALAEITATLTDLREAWLASDLVHAKSKTNFVAQIDALRAVGDALAADETIPHYDWPTRSKISVGGSTAPAKKAFASAARETFLASQQRLEPHARAQDRDVAKAIAFLQPFIENTRSAALEQGVFTFDELILETRRRLMFDPAFRRAVNHNLRAILVDEFQDTDPLQYDIVFMLAARPDEDGAIDRPLEVALRPNVLFIVGDPKQSIYRFRRADITAFGQARDRVLAHNGRSHDLTSNFRSKPAILNEVNRICAVTLAANPPYQLGYEPVVPMAPTDRGDDSGRVDVIQPIDLEPPPPDPNRSAKPGEISAPRRRDLEGALCVELIDELRRSGVAYGAIAILLRKTTETNALLRPLRAAGVPFVLTGSKRFYERHEIILATALLTAIARPHDRIAVLGVLRSAFSGATDRDIYDHVQTHGPRALDPRSRPNEASGPATATLRWLQTITEDCRFLPVDAAIERIFGLDAWTIIEGAGFEGPQSLANLDRLRGELLRAAPLDLAAAAEFLEHHTRRGTDDEESPLFDEHRDAVRIMTVHGSKGLEFDAVILPDLGGKTIVGGGISPNVTCQRAALANGVTAVGIKIGDARNFADFALEAEQNAHAEAEAERLLYVALTRAKRSLHIIRAGKTEIGSWQASLERHGLLTALRTREIGIDLSTSRGRAGDSNPHHDDAASADAVLAAWRAHEAITARDAAAAAAAAAVASAPPGEHGAARDLGIAVHRYLAIAPLADAFDTRLSAACAAAAQVDEDSLRELVEPLHGGPLAQRIAAATDSRREFPVSYLDAAGQPSHGILDLLLREPGDQWTIVDHKTDADATALGLLEAAERHRAQLERYAEGVRRALELDGMPTCAVHFVRASAIVELPIR